MKEYFTEAVVLDKEPAGEFDGRVSLYTEILGKIFAKVRSSRKITSKLSPHLEPLNLIQLRIVQKNGFQVADALKFGALSWGNNQALKLINYMVLEGHPDHYLWLLIKNGQSTPRKILKILGFDPEFSLCSICQGEKPEFFIFHEGIYLCRRCFSGKLNPKEYLELSR